jgi:hypothetical protein
MDGMFGPNQADTSLVVANLLVQQMVAHTKGWYDACYGYCCSSSHWARARGILLVNLPETLMQAASLVSPKQSVNDHALYNQYPGACKIILVV